MTINFANVYLEKLFQGKHVSGKPKYSSGVVLKFKKKVLLLQNANNTQELRSFRSLNFEALKGNLKGFYSVRVDLSYRLIFTVDKDEKITIEEIITIHDLSNHYQ
jgi:proteic killer suppression protein